MTPPPNRLLLASVHDVSPRFESEIDQLLELLAPTVGDKVAMLVVPNHWGDAPIIPGSRFATRLRDWSDRGFEMFLHGFFHRDEGQDRSSADRLRGRWMTAGEGEFLAVDRHQAAERIETGRKLIEDVTGKRIAGFVAPAWLYGDGAIEALTAAQIPIAEDHFRVWSPRTGERLASGPVITWASRTRMRLASSLIAAPLLRRLPLPVLRIGVHPPDSRHRALRQSIAKTFAVARAGRRPARYSDLLTPLAQSVPRETVGASI